MTITKKSLVISWIYIASLFLIDFAVKAWAMDHVHLMNWLYPSYPYGGIGVFQNFLGIDFSINYVQNTGSAWGLFSEYPTPLFIVRSILVFLLLMYQYFFIKKASYIFPITMIIGGALSNLVDCYTYGFVIDMFHFNLWGYHFPVFNVADISICLGVSALIYLSMKESLEAKRARAL
ncbi:MAG: signal peptidase II [Simkaniaceae bacterium]|nr:signal peptidase II [Simkaniaceae bacterium]